MLRTALPRHKISATRTQETTRRVWLVSVGEEDVERVAMVLGVTLRQLHPVSGRRSLTDWEYGRTVWQETKLFRRFRLATTRRIVDAWSRSASSTTRRLFQRTFSDSCWLRRERSRTAQDAGLTRTTEAHTRKECMQRCSSSVLATAWAVKRGTWGPWNLSGCHVARVTDQATFSLSVHVDVLERQFTEGTYFAWRHLPLLIIFFSSRSERCNYSGSALPSFSPYFEGGCLSTSSLSDL
mmetsp:Transcript_18524/g.49695  ORF Transcript_18524/g.49695 Transcript_18524/m.49695 type:complete len:239 (-) Transcript_18524:151-867(-)